MTIAMLLSNTVRAAELGPLLRDEMKGNGRLRAEAARKDDLGAKTLQRPAHPLGRRDFLELGVESGEGFLLQWHSVE
jgi:hypothetical protein